MGSPYYRGCLAEGLVITDLTNAPNVVLSDRDLERTSLEVDHPYMRCVKSLAVGADCVRSHKTYNCCKRYNRSRYEFVRTSFSTHRSRYAADPRCRSTPVTCYRSTLFMSCATHTSARGPALAAPTATFPICALNSGRPSFAVTPSVLLRRRSSPSLSAP